MSHFPNKNYFTMPNEIFSFGLDASEIAVYAYLRCLESRSTYQRWPSYQKREQPYLYSAGYTHFPTAYRRMGKQSDADSKGSRRPRRISVRH